jgi:hypothetical protein
MCSITRFAIFNAWRKQPAVLPPIAAGLALATEPKGGGTAIEPQIDSEPISAFLCVIEYDGENRLVTCRKYLGISEQRYIGAICHAAKGYRQFRCDRIGAVFDPITGEQIGNGAFFDRFALDDWREQAPTWGLTASRKTRLIAGLNALSFMARCDGQWHSLEGEAIERFIVSMWLRMEWPGDPDVTDIVAHTKRLAPDADTFFRALKTYAQDEKLKSLLRRAMADLIAADGQICPAEANWAAEVDVFFNEYSETEYRELTSL